ncbi:ankyrin-1-like isoform X1 [Apiospora arundinis]|uniref:protein S-acyltransferase n=1 Tax=Apiospora arundinis TaxID=335852 RepID=A0ABR2IFX7_9PEZI
MPTRNMAKDIHLPSEILLQIIHYTIQAILTSKNEDGSRTRLPTERLVALRLVNKTFEGEVLRFLHVKWNALQFFYDHRGKRPYILQTRVFAPFAARIFYYRERDQGDEAPSSLLHRVLDSLGVAPDDEGERLRALAVLYEQACDCVKPSLSATGPAWWGGGMPFARSGTPFPSHAPTARGDSGLQSHVVPAAILLGIAGHYENILTIASSSCSGTDVIASGDGGSSVEMLMMGNSEHFGTPLYAAIKAHRNELAHALLDWMRRENRQDAYDCLRAAVLTNNVAMLPRLLHDAQHLLGDGERNSLKEALLEAANLGYVDAASHLLRRAKEAYPDMIDPDFLAQSVHNASLWGHIDYLEFLVQQTDVDLEAQPRGAGFRANALMVAAWRGNTELLHWLLARGVRNGDAGDEYSYGPLEAAIAGDRPESLRILFAAGIGTDTVAEEWDEYFNHVLALHSNEAFRYLVIEEAATLARDPPDFRYWMATACAGGHFGTFEVLLDAGVVADIGAPLEMKHFGSTPGWTAMHFALASSMRGARKIVSKLLEAGASMPDESDYHSEAMGGFREGMFKYTTKRYHSMMPGSTKLLRTIV